MHHTAPRGGVTKSAAVASSGNVDLDGNIMGEAAILARLRTGRQLHAPSFDVDQHLALVAADVARVRRARAATS